MRLILGTGAGMFFLLNSRRFDMKINDLQKKMKKNAKELAGNSPLLYLLRFLNAKLFSE